MNHISQLENIRENERRSHTELYSQTGLYQDGNWLSKPVKTVMELIPLFDAYHTVNILDLGCGIGRNAIALARAFTEISCQVDCVDILDIAIDKLNENAHEYGVSHIIHGITSPIEAFSIPEECYDWILAVSALEHIDSKNSFSHKLKEIKSGIRVNGIVCLIINSEVKEFCKNTGVSLPAQFEVNLLTEELNQLLAETFSGWFVLKHTVRKQHYEIPRAGFTSDLHTNVVTFIARK